MFPGDYRYQEGNSQKSRPQTPPPLPKNTGQGGCHPEVLLPPSPRVMHKRGGVGVGLEAEGYTPDLELGKIGEQTPVSDIWS